MKTQNEARKKSKQGACYCGKPACKWKFGAWVCFTCNAIEERMQSELGPCLVGPRLGYSEFDFRGRVFIKR